MRDSYVFMVLGLRMLRNSQTLSRAPSPCLHACWSAAQLWADNSSAGDDVWFRQPSLPTQDLQYSIYPRIADQVCDLTNMSAGPTGFRQHGAELKGPHSQGKPGQGRSTVVVRVIHDSNSHKSFQNTSSLPLKLDTHKNS